MEPWFDKAPTLGWIPGCWETTGHLFGGVSSGCAAFRIVCLDPKGKYMDIACEDYEPFSSRVLAGPNGYAGRKVYRDTVRHINIDLQSWKHMWDDWEASENIIETHCSLHHELRQMVLSYRDVRGFVQYRARRL